MPFPKTTDAERERMMAECAAIFRRQPGNFVDHPHGLSFAEIERAAHAAGQQLAAKLMAESLATHATDQPEHAPCPTCRGGSRLTRKRRQLTTGDGPVTYDEPAAHCLACRRDFFPDAARTEAR